MNIESISSATGKITAKTLGAIKSAPKATGKKSKSIKDAFVSGYKHHAPAKAKELTIDDMFV